MDTARSLPLHLLSDGQRHAAFCPATMAAVALDEPMRRAVETLLETGDADQAVRTAGVAAQELEQVLCDLASPPVASPCGTGPGSGGETAPASASDSRLERLVLHVSHDCNLRCRYCYAGGGSYGRPREQMPREIALAAANWAIATFGGVRNVQFFGGEPMLNPLLMFEVCEYFAALLKAGHIEALPRFAMVTNGVLGDARYIEFLRRYGVAVTISIDGPEDVHDSLRGAGSFAGADAFARQCLDAGDIEVDFECTWTRAHVERGVTVADLVGFFCERYGPRVVHVAAVAAPPGSPLYLDPEMKREAYAEAARYSVGQFASGELRVNSFSWRVLEALRKREPMGAYCPAGWGTLAVDAGGGIYPCFMFAGDARFRIVVLTGDGRVEDERRAEVAALISTCDKSQRPECRCCWAAPLCSGCLGADLVETGDVSRRASCDTIRAIAETTILEAAHA